jgi:tRNA1Val (adenine37-N6)-methyltransferase
VLPGGFFTPGEELLQSSADESIDLVLDGRVKIIQRLRGYRFAEEALHLCQFVQPMQEARGIDLGTGCGIIAIVLTKEGKVKEMVGLELQEDLADIARRNVSLNGLQGLIEMRVGDIRSAEELFDAGSFHLVVSNPPYRELGRGRLSPSPEKRIAKHEWACSLEDVLRAAGYLLAPEGIFAFCHLDERWQQIGESLKKVGFQILRRENIAGPGGKLTGLVLVEAIKV